VLCIRESSLTNNDQVKHIVNLYRSEELAQFDPNDRRFSRFHALAARKRWSLLEEFTVPLEMKREEELLSETLAADPTWACNFLTLQQEVLTGSRSLTQDDMQPHGVMKTKNS